MSDVDDVVAKDRLHPSAVVGVHLVLQEAVPKGLTVSLDFDWSTKDVRVELIKAKLERCKF